MRIVCWRRSLLLVHPATDVTNGPSGDGVVHLGLDNLSDLFPEEFLGKRCFVGKDVVLGGAVPCTENGVAHGAGIPLKLDDATDTDSICRSLGKVGNPPSDEVVFEL